MLTCDKKRISNGDQQDRPVSNAQEGTIRACWLDLAIEIGHNVVTINVRGAITWRLQLLWALDNRLSDGQGALT